MFLILVSVCVFIFTLIALKDMFDTVISGVPWQQEAFYHQPIDTTRWVRAPTTLSLPSLLQAEKHWVVSAWQTKKKKERSQVIGLAPEPSLFLLKCGSFVPARVRVHECLL